MSHVSHIHMSCVSHIHMSHVSRIHMSHVSHIHISHVSHTQQQTTVTHFGENKRLHLESSKQNYYIISFWAIIKAIFTWVMSHKYTWVMSQSHVLHQIMSHICMCSHTFAPSTWVLSAQLRADKTHIEICPYKRDNILQKRPIILRSLRIVVNRYLHSSKTQMEGAIVCDMTHVCMSYAHIPSKSQVRTWGGFG